MWLMDGCPGMVGDSSNRTNIWMGACNIDFSTKRRHGRSFQWISYNLLMSENQNMPGAPIWLHLSIPRFLRTLSTNALDRGVNFLISLLFGGP